mmetsp:Transcript_12048/g.17756  ORF Transcript_12048/g.17756 Transcript_12048/m.17756 type:complete len:333 (-) Transcript_12048:117-1115(-)
MGRSSRDSPSSSVRTKSCMPSPVLAEAATQRRWVKAARYCTSSGSSHRSTLFHSVTRGTSSRPSSPSSCRTAACCLSLAGLLMSTTWIITSASSTSSKVARKAATRLVGSFWMNPTVSVSSTSGWILDPGRRTLRVVGSRVAKSIFSASTPARVRPLRTVLFPELVYPTRATTGRPSFSLRLRCRARCLCTSLICLFRLRTRSRNSRLSVSIWVSPGPRRPTPPAPDWRSRWVHILVRRGRRYSLRARSTWSFPSFVRACCAKMSRISAVRSSTLMLAFSPPNSCSRFFCWRGDSSSSKMTVQQSAAFMAALISCTLPDPTSVLTFWMRIFW